MPFPPPGLLPNPGIDLVAPVSPALAGRFFITEPGNYLSLTLRSGPSSSQGALVVRNPPASAGVPRVTGSIPGLGRSPGGGNGNPLQYSCLGNPILCPWGPKESSQLSTYTHFRSQAQEGSSHSHVPHPCLASRMELPELPCAGATPEITAELLILYSSQDFPPSKPHVGNPAHRFVMN